MGEGNALKQIISIMSSLEISVEEGKDMDSILAFIFSYGHPGPGPKVFDADYFYHKILKTKGEHYNIDIIYKMLSYEPKVLVTDSKKGTRTSVWVTPIASDFLETGGFTKIGEANFYKQKAEKAKEELSFEKLKYDVKNSRRIFKTYWWTFSISILALILSVINVLKGCK